MIIKRRGLFSWVRAAWRPALGGATLAAISLVAADSFPEFTPGAGYTNRLVPKEPWSIHIVRVDRARGEFEIQSAHALNLALGLSPLGRQLNQAPPQWGVPVAGVNGDFYQRDRAYAGDTRGLQIVDGELISAPADSASFWIDAAGQPHTGRTLPRFVTTWPDGTTTLFGLNEDRDHDAAVLYTPAIGASTRTRADGLELVLERTGEGKWLPLQIGETYDVRVKEARRDGNTPVAPGTLVLSLGPGLAKTSPQIKPGAVLRISTGSSPHLRGARTAISAGPVLVLAGKKQNWLKSAKAVGPTGDYSVRSMSERHPRSGVGWNDRYFYLIGVDGRQASSSGMTLDELAGQFLSLGCTEAMNLDGGGSATMWAGGRLVNTPCDPGHRERDIANSLLVFKKKPSGPSAQTTKSSALN